MSRREAKFSAVVIGRNEGKRLIDCVESLTAAGRIVYVDSGSTDDSVQSMRRRAVDVIALDMANPFTAARARNAGYRYVREIAHDLPYVQFVDGDCELNRQWPEQAISYLDRYPEIGAVCGRRRERSPERSIYNWLCDKEWNATPGETRSFFGDVMIRATALESVGGYREDLIAGEEPELSVRLRAAGWRIWRLNAEMTIHDAAMTQFSQWWRRNVRAGYAFAQGAYIHGAPPERHWVWESRRAWLWGIWLPLLCLMLSVMWPPMGIAAWLVYPLQMLRQTMRNPGLLRERAALAYFQVLARFPEGLGQLKFLRDRLTGARSTLVEYK